MIYTRFGDKVEFIAHCGDHYPIGSAHPSPLMLARVTYGVGEQQSVREKYVFIHTLKVDGGYRELLIAMTFADSIYLEGKRLNAAIQEAS